MILIQYKFLPELLDADVLLLCSSESEYLRCSDSFSDSCPFHDLLLSIVNYSLDYTYIKSLWFMKVTITMAKNLVFTSIYVVENQIKILQHLEKYL